MNQNLVKAYLEGCQLLFRVAPRFKLDRSIVSDCLHVAQKDFHVFRGYYDIDYIDDKCSRHLVHILPQNAKHTDSINLGYFNLTDGKLTVFDHSNAWCWQQGSRLRWFDSTHVIFNDTSEQDYVSRIVDLNTNKTIRVLPKALYDIDTDKDIGLSLNFSRLQRLRPGYGYSAIKDTTAGKVSLVNDGIFKLDIKNANYELLLSLEQMKKVSACDLSGEDYVNHICISPSGKNFIFFYIVTETGKRSIVNLMVSDINGKNARVLEKQVQTSHYTWLDENHLLTTYIDFNNHARQGYRLYNIEDGSFSEFGVETLNLDGHPSFVTSQIIVTDTYPQKNKLNNQYLFSYDCSKKEKKQIGRFYHDARYIGEQRCDLHPSLSGEYVSVDTSCDGLRSVFLMKIRK